jgi:hypothetical protein
LSIAGIEIYFIGKINIFYISLAILLIPLAWKAYLYTFSEYYLSVVKGLNEFEIRIHVDVNENGDIIGYSKIKDIELIPIIKDLYSKEEINQIESYYRHCFYVYELMKDLRKTNTEMLEKYYIIILGLRILRLIGLFYDLNIP